MPRMPLASLNLNTFPHFSPTFTARHASMIHPGSGRAAQARTRPLPCRRRGKRSVCPPQQSPSLLSALSVARPRSPLHLAFHAAQPQRGCATKATERERKVAALLLAAQSDSGAIWGELQHGRRRQRRQTTNERLFVRSFVSPLLDRTDHGRQNRTWKRLDDVNECESV